MRIADLALNDLIPLNQAIRSEIPGSPSTSTVWRWITRGLAAADDSQPRIRLSILYVGNRPFTTRDAIREFIEKSSQARFARSQLRDSDVSHEELEAAGLTSKPP